MNDNIVTYSRSVSINLSRICSNLCAYCDYPENRLDQSQYELTVPYTTIKICNQAKKQGVKEVLFVSGERPDNFSAVRARLDLWGFSSFIEYVYTVCELVFLEGLIPSINIGYISQDEMTIIRRMTASITMMLDTVDEKILQKYAPKKTLNSRLDVIKYAGEGKVPVTTGILVGLGESAKSHKEAFEIIKNLHLKYGNIQNVVIQNFVPPESPNTLEIKEPPTLKQMLETVELAKKILPADVKITVPAVNNPDTIMRFIDLGVRDIGSFDIAQEKTQRLDHNKLLNGIEKQLQKKGLGLQRRLPIFSKYIAGNWYSRKLAQVLDRYKALLQTAEANGNAAAAHAAAKAVKESAKPRKAAKKTKTNKKKRR